MRPLYGVERLDLGDKIRYVGVLVPGHHVEWERVNRLNGIRFHWAAALLAWRVKRNRL